ncbi:MAG TPA: hypothetical protein VI319_01805, partial [Burkholderiales bacterium]
RTDELQFSFDIVAANGHTCAMSGTAARKGAVYVYSKRVGEGQCLLEISVSADAVTLHDAGMICRTEYCGFRGRIDGTSFRRSAP